LISVLPKLPAAPNSPIFVIAFSVQFRDGKYRLYIGCRGGYTSQQLFCVWRSSSDRQNYMGVRCVPKAEAHVSFFSVSFGENRRSE
jgi:hypothetical protein